MESSSTLFRCRHHPRTLEMEGSFVVEKGLEFRNSLVLVLEKQSTVKGWLVLEEEGAEGSSVCGHVLRGEWNDSGELSLDLAFTDANDLTLNVNHEPENFLVKCQLRGTLSGSSGEAGMNGPLFQGECSNIIRSSRPDIAEILTIPEISSDSKVSFRYPHVQISSRCTPLCIRGQKMQIQRIPQPERYVRPGIVEIRHSRMIGRMENSLGLGVHDIGELDVRDDHSLYAMWVYVIWASAFWELRPAGDPNEFYIMTYKQIAAQLRDVCGCLTVMPSLEYESVRYPGCNYASVFYFGEGHECTWKLSPSGRKFVAEVSRLQDDDASHVIGRYLTAPDFKDDNKDNVSYYVATTTDRSKALELEFIYHDPDEFVE